MTPKNENPAPRANAGSRANSDIERNRNNSFALDWVADLAVVWLARHIKYAGGARARPCGPGEPWEGLSMNGPMSLAASVIVHDRHAFAGAVRRRPNGFEALDPNGKRVGVFCKLTQARAALIAKLAEGARHGEKDR